MSLNIQNLDRLISHLEGLPEEEFIMANVYKAAHPCGSACCIIGHAREMIDCYLDLWDILGIDRKLCITLSHPPGYADETDNNKQYPLSRAIRTLKHMRSEYLRTGEVVVDWGAPEPVKKPEWIAPRAVEQAKPTLPAEIVRFLRPADLEVSA